MAAKIVAHSKKRPFFWTGRILSEKDLKFYCVAVQDFIQKHELDYRYMLIQNLQGNCTADQMVGALME